MRLLCLALLTALLSVGTSAQTADLPAVAPGLSDSVRVSLLTMLPGDEVYSLFGHSTLRIADPASGIDRTYNYGTFSFDQPFFVLRFLRGSLDYILDTAPFDLELWKYQTLRRPMIEQRLDLEPDVARALYDRLETNALPQNRSYRYDFFWDNCSTRLLSVLDSALMDAGRPTVDLPPVDEPRTFRQLLDPYWTEMPAVGFGANLGLGVPADQVATAREETFLPLELAAQLDRARLGGRPLVASRDTVFWVPGADVPDRAPNVPLWVAWGVFALGAGATFLGWRSPQGRLGRWGDALLFSVVGLAGLILLLLWTATAHAVTGPNWNLLWAWPTHLGAAWVLAVDRRGSWGRVYFGAAAAITAATVLLWAVLPQTLPAAALPLAALLALRAGWIAWSSPASARRADDGGAMPARVGGGIPEPR